ncbi:hypothetical protein JCM6882_000650 [Rhodosporidiobolus microsporus]
MDPAALTEQQLVDYLVHATEEQDTVFVLYWLHEMKKRGMLEIKDGTAAEGVTRKHSWKRYSALVTIVREEETPLRRFILQLLLHFVAAPGDAKALQRSACGWASKMLSGWRHGGREEAVDAARCLTLGPHESTEWIDVNLPPPPNLAALTGYDPLPPPPFPPSCTPPRLATPPEISGSSAAVHSTTPSSASHSPPLVAQVPLECKIRLSRINADVDRPVLQQHFRMLGGLFGVRQLDGGDFILEFLSAEDANNAVHRLRSPNRLCQSVMRETDYQASLRRPSPPPATTTPPLSPLPRSTHLAECEWERPDQAASVLNPPPFRAPAPSRKPSTPPLPSLPPSFLQPLVPPPPVLSPPPQAVPSHPPHSSPPPPARFVAPPVAFLPASQVRCAPVSGPFAPIQASAPRPASPPSSRSPPIRCHLGNLPPDVTKDEVLNLLDSVGSPHDALSLLPRAHCKSAYFSVTGREEFLRFSHVFHNALLRGYQLHLERNIPEPAPHHPLVIVCGLPAAGGVRLVEDLSRKTRSGAYKREMVLTPTAEDEGLAMGIFRVPSPAAADDAVRFLDDEEVQGRRLTARWFYPEWRDDGSGFEGYVSTFSRERSSSVLDARAPAGGSGAAVPTRLPTQEEAFASSTRGEGGGTGRGARRKGPPFEFEGGREKRRR